MNKSHMSRQNPSIAHIVPREGVPNTASYHLEISVVWGPDASYTLVDTGDGFLGALELLAAGFLQQIRLVEDLFRFQIPNADGFLSPVDVVTFDYRVFVRPW
jgi:hypothetical protein